MPTPQQLSLLRPLMNHAQMLKLLGASATKQLVSGSGEFQRKFGVALDFVVQEDRVDTVTYFSNFSKEVTLFGLSIGMTVAKIKRARPDAWIGEREPSGFTKLKASTDSDDVVLSGVVQRGAVQLILLARADIEVVRAERRRRAEDVSSEPEPAATWASMEDPNATLLAWGQAHPADKGIRDSHVEFANWLIGTSDPDVWHALAMNWNWDNGHAPLLWIVRQKDCDKATALEIFLAGEPSYYLEQGENLTNLPQDQLAIYDLLKEIHERFQRGFYQRSQIAFAGSALRSREKPELRARAESFYPREARETLAGRDLSGPPKSDVAAWLGKLS